LLIDGSKIPIEQPQHVDTCGWPNPRSEQDRSQLQTASRQHDRLSY
jgi:hypothetical protein